MWKNKIRIMILYINSWLYQHSLSLFYLLKMSTLAAYKTLILYWQQNCDWIFGCFDSLSVTLHSCRLKNSVPVVTLNSKKTDNPARSIYAFFFCCETWPVYCTLWAVWLLFLYMHCRIAIGGNGLIDRAVTELKVDLKTQFFNRHWHETAPPVYSPAGWD